MDKDNLLKRLAALGFPLLEPDKKDEANATLAELVAADDPRLWEGFPLVLARCAEKDLFDYHAVEGQLKHPHHKMDLGLLIMLSLALYETLGLKFSWWNNLYEYMGNDYMKQMFEKYLSAFKNNEDLFVQDKVLSAERVKTTFNSYFQQTQAHLDDLLSVKEAMAVEYALSQVFSPKQKELFLKRLRNEKMHKTEREYFSRVVRKKVVALANAELHRLAQGVLQSR